MFQANKKKKLRWCHAWGIWGMQGKSDFSLRHKVEDDFASVTPGIIGVND
jgi:hypothetical protein